MNTDQNIERLRKNIDIPISTVLAAITIAVGYVSEYQLQGNVEKYKEVVESLNLILNNHELSEKFTTFLTFHGGDLAMAPGFFFGIYAITTIGISIIDLTRYNDPIVVAEERKAAKEKILKFSHFVSLGLICLPLILAEFGSSLGKVLIGKEGRGDFDLFDVAVLSVPLIATLIYYLRVTGTNEIREKVSTTIPPIVKATKLSRNR